jgi:hypothetical protein
MLPASVLRRGQSAAAWRRLGDAALAADSNNQPLCLRVQQGKGIAVASPESAGLLAIDRQRRWLAENFPENGQNAARRVNEPIRTSWSHGSARSPLICRATAGRFFDGLVVGKTFINLTWVTPENIAEPRPQSHRSATGRSRHARRWRAFKMA